MNGNADGEVIIEAYLDTKELEKQIRNLKSRLNSLARENDKLLSQKAGSESAIADYKREAAAVDNVKRKAQEYTAQIKKNKEEYARLKEAGEYSGLPAINAEYNQLHKLYSETLKNFVSANSELRKQDEAYNEQVKNLSKVNAKLEVNKNTQAQINSQLQQASKQLQQHKALSVIGNSVKEIGTSMGKVVKRIAMWGVALFGIRSAYNFIRQQMSVLSGYNKKMGADIEYMRFAIASTLQPVIEYILKLAYKLLTYIAYIANAWFDVNIFANASTKAFEKANKSVKATNKSAKELQKTIAGFDEMNILQKNGDVASGGGGGGATTMPNFDLSKWETVEVPGWIKWLAENGDVIKTILIEIGLAIAGIKIANFLKDLGLVTQSLSGFKTFLMGLGIGLLLYGIYEIVSSIIKLVTEGFSWDTLMNLIKGVGVAILGIATAILAVQATNMVGWVMAVVGAVTMLVSAIGKTISKLFEHKKELSEEEEAQKRVTDATKKQKEALEKLNTATNNYVSAVDNAEDAEKRLIDAEKKHKISGQELFDLVSQGKLDYKNMNDAQKEVYKAYLNNKDAQDRLTQTTKDLKKANNEEATASLEKEIALDRQAKSYDGLAQSITDAYNQGKISAKDAADISIEAMNHMSDEARKTFVEQIPQDILQAFDVKQFGKARLDLITWWNNTMKQLNGKITVTAEVKTKSTSSSSKGYAKGAIAYFGGAKLPRLASGGILNQPGRGVPIANAIVGERGMEGVLPLTDSQQMALLGKAIGEYITINANIVNSMNGRVISREIKKISADDEFAYNS